MTTRRFLQVFAVLAALMTPFAAAAHGNAQPQVSPIQALLMGGQPLDPYATTLDIAPPADTTVMITKDGKAVSWLSRPGTIAMKRNATYGITAIRGGKSMIFSQMIVARPGKHTLSWNDGVASLSFVPFVVYATPTAGADVHVHVHGADKPVARRARAERDESAAPAQVSRDGADTLSESRFERVQRHMAMLPTDELRLNVLRPWTMRAVFSDAQARDLKATFVSRQARRQAASMLRGRTAN